MAYTTATTMSSGKGKRLRLNDFVLRWSKRRQSAQEQLSVFRALASRKKD